MIESKQEVSKDLERALQALEQAKQRVSMRRKNRISKDDRRYGLNPYAAVCY